MNKLSARQMDILSDAMSNVSLSINNIALKNKISKRTVYRELSTINEFINEYNLRLKNNQGNVVLMGSDEDKRRFNFDVIGMLPTFDASQRKKLVLSELLQMKEPIKLEYFANEFGVTTATISYDLIDIKKWLNNQEIEIVTKPGVGVYLKGEESSFRKAIINFLYDNVNTEDLMEFLNQGYIVRNKLDENINDRLLRLIDYDTVLKIEKAIVRLEKHLEFDIAESSYMGLTVHLALAVKRINDGEKIKIGEESLKELKKSDEYKFAKLLSKYLEDELKISIPEDEIGYITIHLQGAKYRANTDDIDDDYVNEIIQNMIKKADEIFDTDLKDDTLLQSGLKAHLRPTIYRLKMGLSIRNPLIDDIKSMYGELFKKCKIISNVLKNALNVEVPDDEIGYLAMHFGASLVRKNDRKKKYNILVVCASGIGTSRMLLSKLKMFPEINVVDTVSSLKVKYYKDKKNIDLIVSTIPLNVKEKKTIVVNPLLLDNDIEKLKSALNTDFVPNYADNIIVKDNYDELVHIANYGKSILNIVDDFILKNSFGTNSEEIIDELLKHYLNTGIIDLNKLNIIKERLLGRESLGKIILPGKGFVIYHCLFSDIRNSLVICGKLQSEIKMKNLANENEKINSAFLMVAPENDKTSIEILGDLSVSFIENEELVNDINNAKNTNDARDKIKRALMQKFYREIKRNLL